MTSAPATLGGYERAGNGAGGKNAVALNTSDTPFHTVGFVDLVRSLNASWFRLGVPNAGLAGR